MKKRRRNRIKESNILECLITKADVKVIEIVVSPDWFVHRFSDVICPNKSYFISYFIIEKH